MCLELFMSSTFSFQVLQQFRLLLPAILLILRVGRLPTLHDRSAPVYLKRSELCRGLLSESEFRGALVKLLL